MKAVELSPSARKELYAAVEWYETRSQGLGVKFFELVDEAFASIALAPASFPPVWTHHRAFHRIVIERFPYILLFRFTAEEIFVFALAHTRRRSGYWLSRARGK